MFSESDNQINIQTLLSRGTEMPNLLDPSDTDNNTLNLHIAGFMIIYIYLLILLSALVTPAVGHAISNKDFRNSSTKALDNDNDEIKETEADSFQDIECD
ncbi:conserved Plasmodium protein, unknown function [Plasmodium sp. gorilla clade G2]|uniref:conserved Plasmodium protein, unknown function n=1 Tax=Plasmodium sp. gorilla clade G2 TaxID=880535 RepID=UPI000D22359C|nr:conserved Plasmodium protein, unknown function [Plasmodium sp. gorilla clade G2]SOV19974.1 conserved Plasmodium protein, unknown function [Plasmodium sp. gorilla clade G2]